MVPPKPFRSIHPCTRCSSKRIPSYISAVILSVAKDPEAFNVPRPSPPFNPHLPRHVCRRLTEKTQLQTKSACNTNQPFGSVAISITKRYFTSAFTTRS
jgi:hypothetical protein